MFENTRSLFQNPVQGLTVGREIRDQRMPFMFEVVDAKGVVIEEYILPVNPESYRIITPTRATATQTQAGAFEDNIGYGLQRIMLQGTFGYLGSYPGGQAWNITRGNPKSADGWKLAQNCERILLRFYARFGTTLSNGKKLMHPLDPKNPPALHFFNYTDKDYFLVQLNKFELSRNTQRRMLYQYDIQMTCLRRLDEPSIPASAIITDLPSLQQADQLSIWGQLLKGYTQVSNVMNAVINDIGQIQSNLATIRRSIASFRQGISDFIDAPFRLVSETTKTVDTVLDTIISLKEIPHELTDLLRSTKRDMLTLSKSSEKFKTPETAGTTSQTTAKVTEIMTAPLPTGIIDGSIVVMDIPETSLFATQESSQKIAVKAETINGTDTIETIAARILGNADEWKRIAMLNNLESPYIVKDPLDQYSPVKASAQVTSNVLAGSGEMDITSFTPASGEVLVFDTAGNSAIVDHVIGATVYFTTLLSFDVLANTTVTLHERQLSVLKEGDKILIPGDNQQLSAITTGSNDDLYSRLFGIDEYLDENGDQSADQDGSVRSTSGIDNLCMQLRHRLMTVKGELPRHPEYGSYLPKLIGKIGTDFWYERAILEAKITMLEDPRVQDVGVMSLTAQGNAIYLDADVYPINQTAPTQMNLLLAA